MITRENSLKLLNQYIKSQSLLNHSKMVASAMEAYANKLKLTENEVNEWWTAGLLHDLDWEAFPNEHPNKAVNEILPDSGYSDSVLNAIKAHAPDRTGKKPESLIERHLFACDELSGFINAASLIRPNGYEGMEVSSIKKKLKDKRFAANVSREDIIEGAKLIELTLEDHIAFLIKVFSEGGDSK
jgi:putative nucleotidyltransferase with HDIG domain